MKGFVKVYAGKRLVAEGENLVVNEEGVLYQNIIGTKRKNRKNIYIAFGSNTDIPAKTDTWPDAVLPVQSQSRLEDVWQRIQGSMINIPLNSVNTDLTTTATLISIMKPFDPDIPVTTIAIVGWTEGQPASPQIIARFLLPQPLIALPQEALTIEWRLSL